MEWYRKHNILASSVARQKRGKPSHQGMNSFKDAIEKSPANDKDQSAKTRSFLEVSFPLKTLLAFGESGWFSGHRGASHLCELGSTLASRLYVG